MSYSERRFNTQPPEGGWEISAFTASCRLVSTHSRPKAAGTCHVIEPFIGTVSTHSRPKAAGRRQAILAVVLTVSTHSRPKAAGLLSISLGCWVNKFQHTAARRRLVTFGQDSNGNTTAVSTHSRPKAAGASLKSLAPSGFTAPISLSSQEKQKCEYNTAFSVASVFAIS